MEWQRPPERIGDLLRQGATTIINNPQPWLDELDEAILSAANMQEVAGDPVLAAGLRRVIRSNVLHWAAANVDDPGAPVAANVGPEPLSLARDLLRRGLTPSALRAYRILQSVFWQRWMTLAFRLTSRNDELQELLTVSARSMFSFIDDTNAAIAEQMQRDREELTRGTQAERRETVELILAGASVGKQRAASRLGYNLEGDHTAAIVWSDLPDSDPALLNRATEALARVARSDRTLTVVATVATRWVWITGAAPPDLERLESAIDDMRGVRIAVGATAPGIDGFRSSHFDAVATQRLLVRLHSAQRVAGFDTVELVSLVTQDATRADRFVKRTLGDFESASPELRTAVRTFINEQCNASRAATRLYTHRNTLLRQLTRADELLPRPLAENSVNVAVALEVVHWRADGRE
ncbi:transcriptional regulator [Mycobacterium sp. IEC1808]|uniref:PucR family transcriptional regulator n=1 Tax=Mycobacterium sp. IEC1808 TaxID=1743230 RepID=UPI000A15AEEF|nr:PucR family transcriptional regulator [Mycobacterium sp. IEC1808]ORW97259.1 transcriptional regulator [Mycobacterium sp. IEC1808]